MMINFFRSEQPVASTNQAHYLNLMGIERWRLRDGVASNSSVPVKSCYAFLLGDTSSPVGLLVAEARLFTEEEANLAAAIVKATKKLYTGGECAELPEFGEKLGSMKVSIVLGEVDLPQHVPQPILTTHALADLLNNKNLKAEAWGTLKKAMVLMNGVS
jgi:hypothetical protein